jgi:hypothetical protein
MDADVNIPTLTRQSCRQDKLLQWHRCGLGAMALLHFGQIGNISASRILAQVLLSF